MYRHNMFDHMKSNSKDQYSWSLKCEVCKIHAMSKEYHHTMIFLVKFGRG